MKKILIATTALVATAGVASAEIKLSGVAEMGLVGGAAYGDVTQFWTDVDVTFTMTGEADNGLTFGAKVDLDENGAFAGTTQGGETLYVAYGPAKLTMGDVDGAFDAAMTEVNVGGSIDDSETVHWGFSANSGLDGTYDGQIAQFEYAFSGFTGYLSVEVDDTPGVGHESPVWGLGVKYVADVSNAKIGVGIGYQKVDRDFGFNFVMANGTVLPVLAGDVSIWGISLDTTFNNGVQALVNYSDFTSNGMDYTHWALGLGYTMNALTVAANYGEYDYDYFGIDAKDTGWGLVADYDLGGGLEVQFGYGSSDFSVSGTKVSDTDSFSLGLSMSF